MTTRQNSCLSLPKRTKHLHNLPTSITIGNAQTPFKQSVKNLGLTLDCHLTMNAHVSSIARTCYFELHRLASIHGFLTSTSTATVVSAFGSSRIDYCNSLLFGSTHDATSHWTTCTEGEVNETKTFRLVDFPLCATTVTAVVRAG